MPGSHPTRWIVLLLCGALGCVGSTDAPAGETGSLSLDLVLAGGIEIDEVAWEISGNSMEMSGNIDVSAPGSTASVEVFGLPPGEMDYTVALTATSSDEAVTCEGSAPFNVEVGKTTNVMVILNCKKQRTLGGVRVNGKFNICTELTKAVVSPLQTSVGNDISLSAQAFDEEGDAIHYIWTGDGGSIADPSAASTTYTCQDVGEHMVTILVTDNDVYCNMASWTIPVTCIPGDVIDLCEDVICEDDGNECTEAACNPANGLCETSNVADGTECDGGTCSAGVCVETDLCEGVMCEDDGNQCTTVACDPADGVCKTSNVADGTDCNGGDGMCVGGQCMMTDLCEGVTCDDTGNECTVEMCNMQNGQCEVMNVPDGTECDGGNGACSSGECVDNNLCEGVDCTSDNDCVQDGTCDPADGLCDPGDPEPADTACDLSGTDDGFCDGTGTCVECNADAQCPDDGNECTAEACTSDACSTSPVADGTMCDNDMGVCDQGECVPANLCEGKDCSDGNECTQDLCDPATGDCSNPAEPDGTQCICPLCGAEGVCEMGVCIDPCDGVDCSDGNQCTADLCQVGICSNPNLGPGAACDQDGGSVCDGAGTCVECINDGQCSGSEVCTDNTCVPGVIDPPPASKAITVGCTNSVTDDVSILNWTLGTDPGPLVNGQAATIDLSGTGQFDETFLDAAQSVVPGGVQKAILQSIAATVLPRTGLVDNGNTDASVGVLLGTPDASVVPFVCANDADAQGNPKVCDPANDVVPPSPACSGEVCGNTDCLFNFGFPSSGDVCRQFVDVPTSTDCGCTAGSGACACDAIDQFVPGDQNKLDTQCAPNGFCVTGSLNLPLAPAVGSYIADSTAGAPRDPGTTPPFDVLMGWADNATRLGAPVVCSDDVAPAGYPANACDGGAGTYALPAPAVPTTTTVPPPPVGLRVNAGGLGVAVDCLMAVAAGEDTDDIPDGEPDQSAPTPEVCNQQNVDDGNDCAVGDELLLRFSIQP